MYTIHLDQLPMSAVQFTHTSISNIFKAFLHTRKPHDIKTPFIQP